jgi:hypothetical protein
MNLKAIGAMRDSEKARLKLPRKATRRFVSRQPFAGKNPFSLKSFLFAWQKNIHIRLECIRQNKQFSVRHTAKLCLNFRERCTTQIPSLDRTTCGKHFLCQSLLIAQFSDLWSDNILWFGHAPKMELDTKTSGGLNCADFGAT